MSQGGQSNVQYPIPFLGLDLINPQSSYCNNPRYRAAYKANPELKFRYYRKRSVDAEPAAAPTTAAPNADAAASPDAWYEFNSYCLHRPYI